MNRLYKDYSRSLFCGSGASIQQGVAFADRGADPHSGQCMVGRSICGPTSQSQTVPQALFSAPVHDSKDTSQAGAEHQNRRRVYSQLVRGQSGV